MHGEGMTSVNVAVAAAAVLYALERDLARRGIRRSRLGPRDVDILVEAPDDPSELGSLLRSAWAFGWRRVFLSDPGGVWFTNDREIVLAGRAAARREVNPLVIARESQLREDRYERVIRVGLGRRGTPLSRLALPDRGKVLVVIGAEDGDAFVDFKDPRTPPRFRHAGSVVLSVISQMLRRGRGG
jgi:tRNA G18 (ribose-2'-O)-methylase SpoU